MTNKVVVCDLKISGNSTKAIFVPRQKFKNNLTANERD
jgi:hypothetical protein